MEYLALKRSATAHFRDYIYVAAVVVTDNPLAQVNTTANIGATGERWIAALSNYTFIISYSVKHNADGQSRINKNISAMYLAVTLVELEQAH